MNIKLFSALGLGQILIAFYAVTAMAATPLDAIKNLHGCFAVSYRFVEDGKNSLDLHGDIYEWIDYREESGVYKFQHIGILNGNAQKHWREEWQEVSAGIWSQKVIGPNENFRYECKAPFVFNQWRCMTLKNPKPLRDRRRTDYATLDRENTLQISSDGWVQVENNTKRTKEGVAVANEVGWIEYRRSPEIKCEAGKKIH